MDLWLQQKYANILCSNFRNFKVKKNSPYLVNFSCEVCGDSSLNKKKARAFIGEKNNNLFYHCHNCNASYLFVNYLYHKDNFLYKQYAFEKYKENKNEPVPDEKVVEFFEKINNGPFKKLQSILDLDWQHPAKQYVLSRQIPLKYHHRLRYAPDFNSFVNSIFPDKLNANYKEGRLVIPFLDENGECFGFQGRNFSENKTLRYITIMLTQNKPKIFGLDTVNWSKPVYVFEGCIDAMCLPNSIAVAQGDLMSINGIIKMENCIFIPDKDVRNKQIMKKTKKLLEEGLSVCMLPENFKGKDINEAIVNGLTDENIMNIIQKNTFKGMKGLLHFTKWSQITI